VIIAVVRGGRAAPPKLCVNGSTWSDHRGVDFRRVNKGGRIGASRLTGKSVNVILQGMRNALGSIGGTTAPTRCGLDSSPRRPARAPASSK